MKVNLLGRYMLADRREFPCQVVDMSPGGMAVIAPMAGKPGERVIAYIDHLGRLEGKIARTIRQRLCHDDFGDPAQARQARRPTDLACQPADPQSAGRPPPRPLRAAQCDGAAGSAERHQCRLPRHRPFASGAAIAIAPDLRPPVGAVVTIGKTTGRVVRHIEDGFAIEFMRLQHPDFVEENVTGE